MQIMVSPKDSVINTVDSIHQRIYIIDSLKFFYIYKTELKNGYRLEYRVYTESSNPDTLQTLFLMKGSIEIKDLNGGSSFWLPQKNIGYIGADFDSSFVFVRSFGSGNPHYMQLVDKKTGDELLKGIWVDADEDEQIILYIEGVDRDSEQLKIYDVKNNNEIIVNDFNDSKCVEYEIGGLRDCVKIDTVTKAEVVLKIDTDKERIVKKYNR